MFWFHTLSIDLGTANTLIYDLAKGLVLQEPSAIAFESETEEVVAQGQAAEDLQGRSPSHIQVKRPLKDGVIVSLEAAEKMLSRFIRKVLGNYFFLPHVIVGVPSGSSGIERQALADAVSQARAKLYYLIDEPVAAAIGAGLPVLEPGGSMVIDIGGGTSEVAVLCQSGVVFSESINIAGDELTDYIKRAVQQQHHLLISDRTAERIKHEIGTAYPDEGSDAASMEVIGINLLSNLPGRVTLTGAEIREMIAEPVGMILGMVRRSLEQLQPDLAVDIAERGMTLLGGGALLKGLDRLISETFDIGVNVPPEPMHCVVLGENAVMADPHKYCQFLVRMR